jgi:hypothetical protein
MHKLEKVVLCPIFFIFIYLFIGGDYFFIFIYLFIVEWIAYKVWVEISGSRV